MRHSAASSTASLVDHDRHLQIACGQGDLGVAVADQEEPVGPLPLTTPRGPPPEGALGYRRNAGSVACAETVSLSIWAFCSLPA